MANKPAYVVRAKTGRKDEHEKDIFITVGAAFAFNRGDGFMLNIQSLPVAFDGTLMLTVPKDDERTG